MDNIKFECLKDNKFLIKNEDNGTSSEFEVLGDKVRDYSFYASKDSEGINVNLWKFPMFRIPLVLGEPTWCASFYFDAIFNEKQIGLQLIVKLPLDPNGKVGIVPKDKFVEYYVDTIKKVSELNSDSIVDLVVNEACWVKKSSL